MKVKVLFFARSRELVGVTETEFELETGQDSVGLEELLLKWYPNLREIWSTCVLARNQEYLAKGESVVLNEGDEIAVIPPISGG